MLYDVAPIAGFDPQVSLLLATLDDSTREWRKHLGEPSIEALTWQPWPGGYSVGALILHIIEVELFWLEGFLAELPEDTALTQLLMSEQIRQYDGHWPVPPAQPLSWYYDLHDRVRARAREAIRALDPGRVYSRGDNSCTLNWVLAHVVEHDSYHGGQAVVLHEMWKRMK